MANIADAIKRHKLKVFNAYPYPAQVIVYVIGEEDALRKVFPDLSPVPESTNGRCSWLERDGFKIVTIGIRSDLSDFMAVLAHECYHAMNCIYSWFGAEHEIHNDEPGAYFLGYLARETAIRFAELTDGGTNG